MADRSVSIRIAAGGETLVEFPAEHVAIRLDLVQVGPRLFRIGSVPIMVEAANFGDVIEVESRPGGSLRFTRVAEAGGWCTYDFVRSVELLRSPRITAIQDHVLSLGGYWEQVFGGVLFLCLPPTSNYDPTEDIPREG